jgi:hypothetical protein
MELPCEICTAKLPPKGELVEIGGKCFLGSASILFDATVGDSLDRSWNMCRFVLRIWQRHICWVWKELSTDN